MPKTRKPEQRVVKLLIRWLLALGYEQHQIQTEYKIHDRSGQAKWIDVAVFQGKGREESDLLLIAECKKAHEGGGLEQLRNYLDLCGTSVGIWFNGIHFDYLVHWRNALGYFREVDVREDPAVVFGRAVRKRRRELNKVDPEFSLRKVAARVGINHSYLSKVEQGKAAPPSDGLIFKLAEDLEMDSDTLFAKAGGVPPDVREIVMLRPKMMGEVLNALKDAPAEVIQEVARRVKDGDW